MKQIALGLLGLGNVGAGVVKLLDENAAAIAGRLGARVGVRRILVRQPDKTRLVEVDRSLLTQDPEDILRDDQISIVVELLGGEEPAREHVLGAMARGKHVVTANKLLLATHADELFRAAELRKVNLLYEASVCGGVPVLRALREGLASDRIDSLLGIVNGTSNYILTKMTDEGRHFGDLLREAQSHGIAEADPALDIEGHDALHKLAILIGLSFGVRVPVDQIYREGISQIEPIDIQLADRFGYKIKPLVIARDIGGEIEARVHPTMIPKRFMLASVDGLYNAIYVSSYALGHSMYYGRGAGMMPTAVAVVSDVIEACRDILAQSPARGGWVRPGPHEQRKFRKSGAISSRYYLRFSVVDKPGVLAQIAGILGAHGISISEVVQDRGRPNESGAAQVVVLTHEAQDGPVRLALAEIDRLETALHPTRLVRIFD